MAETNPELRREIERDLDAWLEVDVPLVDRATGEIDPESLDAVAPAPDESFADRLLYKARRISEEMAAVSAHAAARRAEIDAWEEDRLGGSRKELARIRRSLEGFFRQYHIAHPRKKSLPLVNGTLKLRSGRGKIVVEDEYAFVAWAEAHGRRDLLRYEPKVAKAQLADEQTVTRHRGVVKVVDAEERQTYRLMVQVPRTEGGEPAYDRDGAVVTESVSVPGVVYAEPVGDRFDFELPKPTTETEE